MSLWQRRWTTHNMAKEIEWRKQNCLTKGDDVASKGSMAKRDHYAHVRNDSRLNNRSVKKRGKRVQSGERFRPEISSVSRAMGFQCTLPFFYRIQRNQNFCFTRYWLVSQVQETISKSYDIRSPREGARLKKSGPRENFRQGWSPFPACSLISTFRMLTLYALTLQSYLFVFILL